MIDSINMKQVPLTILAGFLGAGKTTVLNTILNGDHGLRVAVLVNDFGAINIDAQLVVGVEGETVSLANGCICCTIRDDLLAAVASILKRPEPPQYIVVECSGVSDPVEVANSFRIPAMIPLVRIDSILTVVDAEQVRSLEKEYEMLAFNQISIADIVILNKVDLVTPQQLAGVRNWVREIIPNARILETTFGNVPLELVLGVGQFDVERLAQHKLQAVHVHSVGEEHDHQHSHDHAMVFSTWSWTSQQPLSLKALRTAINQLPDSVFRAKGVIYVADEPDHRAVLQVVGVRARLLLGEAWGNQVPLSQIVVIGAYGSLDAEVLQAQFDTCLAVNASQTERSSIADTVLDWLRGRKR